MKKIIELNHSEARAFFLKTESYCNFDLPKYFAFGDLIQKISSHLGNTEIEQFYKNFDSSAALNDKNPKKPYPSEFQDVNYTLLNNKDGKFAWRPFQLMHPVIYVALVHKITEQNNWTLIKRRFVEFGKNLKIICHSVPVLSEDNYSDKAATIICLMDKQTVFHKEAF